MENQNRKSIVIVVCVVVIVILLAVVGLSLTGVINIKTLNENSVAYEVVDRVEQDSLTNYQELYVNNILVELSDQYARIKVTKLSDIFIVEASNASSTLYAVDKHANIIGVFVPENNNIFEGINKIVTKANYRETYRVEGNNIYVTTDRLSQDSNYVLCNMITNDNDVVVYEEKFTYLGNNKFSEAEIVNTVTRKQYMEDNNLNCGNKNNTELSYKIVDYTDQNTSITYKQLYVDNQLLDLKGKYTNIKVSKLSDILIVEASNASSTLYAVDKQANIIGVFVQENNNAFEGINKIVTKANYRDTYRVEGNDIYITTDRLSQDPNYVLCNMITNDNDIVVYEEKFTYLGNNKFSNAEVVNSISRKQYMQEHNISCNN